MYTLVWRSLLSRNEATYRLFGHTVQRCDARFSGSHFGCAVVVRIEEIFCGEKRLG